MQGIQIDSECAGITVDECRVAKTFPVHEVRREEVPIKLAAG
jgi:hypothetical protein